MEKLICYIYVFLCSTLICSGQSGRTTIPLKEVNNKISTSLMLDSSFVIWEFRDFNLYYPRNNPIVFPFRNITDSLKVLVYFDFYIKKHCINVKTIKIGYLDRPIKLSKKDSLKIANTAFKLFRKKSFYIKYFNDINPDWTYYLQIPIVLTRKKENKPNAPEIF